MNSLVRLTDFDPDDDECLVGDETGWIFRTTADVWENMLAPLGANGLRVVRTDRPTVIIPLVIRPPADPYSWWLTDSDGKQLSVTLHPQPYRIDDWEIRYAFSEPIKTYVIQGTPRRLSSVATVGSHGH